MHLRVVITFVVFVTGIGSRFAHTVFRLVELFWQSKQRLAAQRDHFDFVLVEVYLVLLRQK